MKVLYEDLRKPKEYVDENHQVVEEFPLQEDILKTIIHDLNESNALLPESAQILQNWKVGLLDRFDPAETETGHAVSESTLPIRQNTNESKTPNA